MQLPGFATRKPCLPPRGVQPCGRLMAALSMLPSLHRQFEHWLFDLPESVDNTPLRWASVPLRYVYALTRDLIRGELGHRAMSLVYSTLFAIVPIVAVAFSVLKAFGYHKELEPVLFEFLQPLGDHGYELTVQIMEFVENVQSTLLGTIGFVFLLYTVISMIQKVEGAFNFVWHVERPRSLARRLSEYTVVMIVGPVVAVVALGLLASFEASDVVRTLSGIAGSDDGSTHHIAPYVLIVGLFAFVYSYMPNTRIELKAAFIGALFAGSLWAAVGALFARIVVYSTKTMVIYAGFAVVLIFLLWIYISWLILLLGAQLSFYVQNPEHLRYGHSDIPMTGALRERIALSIMCLIGQRFAAGQPRWDVNDLAERLNVPGVVINDVVTDLEDHGLVLTAEDESIAPARDLDAITLASIFDAIRHETPNPRHPKPRAVCEADAAAKRADDAVRTSVAGQTLRDLVTGAASADPPR
jgi:membrane protein